MTSEHEDFERCPACGQGLEPRVVSDHLETVEESIQLHDGASAAVMVCPNPDCPALETPENLGAL